MKTKSLLYTLVVGLVIFSSCKKEDAPAQNSSGNTNGTNCYLVKTIDSISQTPSATALYYYNANHQQIKYYNSVRDINGPYSDIDTFIYSNNKVIKFVNSTSLLLNSNPYYKADYTYTNNILSSSTSFLYFLNVPYTNNNYTFDTAGRLTKVVQKALASGIGLGSYTTIFEYDNNSNLVKITKGVAGGPTFICAEFFNYDDKPNPYYKLPWRFDCEVYMYDTDNLSRNNPGRTVRYDFYQSRFLLSDESYTYVYDNNGKVIKVNKHRNDNLNAQDVSRRFYYECF